MIVATLLTKISIAGALATSLPISSLDLSHAAIADFTHAPVAITAPAPVRNTRTQLQDVMNPAVGLGLDFTRVSLGTNDLFREGELDVMLSETKTFSKAQNIIEANANSGTSLKYYNIATFSIGKNNRLSKEDKPTLFGEKLLNELTGIQLVK